MTTDWKKLGKQNRAKGAAYERKIAKELTKITGYKWSRVPYSGASYIPGDVTIVDGDFIFPHVVELKNRQDLTLAKVYRNPKVMKQYLEENTILIFKSDGRSYVVIPACVRGVELLDIDVVTRIFIDNDGYDMFDIKYFDLIVRKDGED